MSLRIPIGIVLGLAALIAPASADGPPLAGARRVVFLGDSITYSGQYIEYVETFLRLRDPSLRVEFIDLGLPSETVSGLTEPGHAGGAFPRPDLHERLGRILDKARPDVVVACYGMNDGIYHPFADARFAAFRDGIDRLHARAVAADAKVVHLTPPVFDPEPIRAETLPAGLPEYRKPYRGYDDVLARYSAWLLSRRADGWDVVDVHGPMKSYLDEKRTSDPTFRLAADGVHLDATGHAIIARALLAQWGVTLDARPTLDATLATSKNGPAILAAVRARQRVLRDAWLGAIGHKRPGVAKGLPIAEAQKVADEADATVVRLLNPPQR